MHPLLSAEAGIVRLLLGNEAIVRGALEAGVGFVSTYPGTPSSEIGDTFFSLFQEAGIEFEYSVNEKVALEVAGAVAAAGVRTLAAMKHVGVNVAADPLMTLAYIGVRGGLVLVSADDPGCHSSQNEQDNRHYARLGKFPMLEPATPEQAYELVKEAFELSERVQMPVLLRTTTRVSHTRRPIVFGDLAKPKTKGEFLSDKRRFTPVPGVARLRHPVVEATLKQVEAEFEESALNKKWGTGKFGILTSGVSACYVEDVVKRLQLEDRVCVLHLATTYPMPRRLLTDFVRQVDRALVVEELDPVLETELRSACVRAGKLIEVYGKESGHFSLLGELGPDQVATALVDLLGLPDQIAETAAAEGLPPRPPMLCPGCPHRATYYAIKLALGDEAHFVSDIGCYTLGFMPPLDMGDYFICMGSSASGGGGFAATLDKPVVAFIGDSTFFHSGITGLINSVHNRRNMLLVVLDNDTTGMTGHQPHPGTESTGAHKIDIEKIAQAAGVEHVATIDPLNLKQSTATIRDLLSKDGPKVLISHSPCPLFIKQFPEKRRSESVKYTIDHEKCMYCARCDSSLFCDLEPCVDYSLARARARVQAGPDQWADYATEAPEKMQTPPCEAACPLGLCIQGYVEAVAAGDVQRARALIRQRLVMPHTICRVCHHPCEDVCIRGDVDEPIAINQIKRWVMDAETEEDRLEYIQHVRSLIRENGKKVAVIGAGPAGLSCATDLCLRGYGVEVFEVENEAGGMCSYGIPGYRLPRDALAKDLQIIEGLGVQIQCGVRFGQDVDLAKLQGEGYHAVFLAPGLAKGARLGIEGEDLSGVIDAMQWLRQVNLLGLEEISGRVVVVGGGNAAIDATRCAMRLGAASVSILYRRTREEMPAISDEIEACLHEGAKLIELATPAGVTQGAGKGLQVVCRRMKLGAVDIDGRRKPEPTDETFSFETDWLITAIGQMSSLTADELPAVEFDRWGRIVAQRDTGKTGNPIVFAGGDAVSGPASVVEALQSGKLAAYGIDRVLSDDPNKVIVESLRDSETLLAEPRYKPVDVAEERRRSSSGLDPAESLRSFAEVEKGYDAASAIAEAKRCLACGLCAACNNCLVNFGCPAFYGENGKVQIDPILCDGCGTCVQVCPNGAIIPLPAESGGVS